MNSLLTRVAAGAVAGVAAVGLTVTGGAAAADTVTLHHQCGLASGPFQSDWHVTITAPATAARGSTVTVTADIVNTRNNTDPVPANKYRGELRIKLGGASTGEILATGLINPQIDPGTPWRLLGGSAQVTLANAGDVTFSELGFRVLNNDQFGVPFFGCSPVGTVPVADTTHVS
jgi:hypothetical protein